MAGNVQHSADDNTESCMTHPTQAWVIFSGQTDHKILGVLRPGFRHCYVLLKDARQWITVDPLFPYTEIVAHDIDVDFDLPLWLSKRGHMVIAAKINRHIRKPAPVRFYTCVETVKRVLGLHAWHVFTPYQLYRYLLSLSDGVMSNGQ